MKCNDVVVDLGFAFVLDHFGEHLGAIETKKVNCQSSVFLQRLVGNCLVLGRVNQQLVKRISSESLKSKLLILN